MHADHIAGLPGVLFMVAHAERTEPLDIYGPPGTAYVVEGLRRIAADLPFPIHIHELKSGEQFELPAGLHGSCIAASHGVPCLAYRVELERKPLFQPEQAQALGLPVQLWSRLQHGETVQHNGQTVSHAQVLGPPRRGISLAFITDTRPTTALSQFARDVDLLICESTYDDPEDLPLARAHAHMLAEEAAALAQAAGAHALILTHFSPKISDVSIAERTARRIFTNTRSGIGEDAPGRSFGYRYVAELGAEVRQNERVGASRLSQRGGFLCQHVGMGSRQWQILGIVVRALADQQIDIACELTQRGCGPRIGDECQ